MSFCWSHPTVWAIEIAWRWVFGIPFLWTLWSQGQQILLRIPPDSAGLDRINLQNPWVSSVLLADAAGIYRPAVVSVLHWLVPCAVVAWAIASGIGRSLVLARIQRIDPVSRWADFSVLRRVPSMIALQGVWLVALLGFFWLWFAGVSWAAATHITSSTEPDLIGYLCWLIFLSLGLFTLWALLSWCLAVAPVLYFQGARSALTAFSRAFRLGRPFSGKLAEVNLVMAIVKIALIVLAMVFSAAPLPFSDQFGPDGLNGLYKLIAIAFLLGSDYFHVVRLKAFRDLWQYYRGESSG